MSAGPGSIVTTAPALPGEAQLDPELLTAAAADLKRVMREKGLESVLAIGERVVHWFGGGDVNAFVGRAGQHATWAALAEDAGLKGRQGFLWNCVAVYHQVQQMPDDVARELTPTHHQRLLVLKDPEQRLALAQKAVEEGLTVKELGAEVAAAKKEAKQPRRGRPTAAPFVNTVNQIARLVDQLDLDQVTAESVAALGEDKQQAVLERLAQQLRVLEGLRSRIEEASLA